EFVAAEARDPGLGGLAGLRGLVAVPGEVVPRAHAKPQSPRDLVQHGVARSVAQRVVDPLETVEVDEHDRDSLAVAPRPPHGALEVIPEELPVGQPGQAVEEREPADLPLRALALRDVLERPVQAHDLSVGDLRGALAAQNALLAFERLDAALER